STSSNVRVGASFIDGAGGFGGFANGYGSGANFVETIQFESTNTDVQGNELLALHEIGHILGLGHSTSPLDVMYPTVSTQPGLSFDDIAGGRYLYNTGTSFQGTAGADS